MRDSWNRKKKRKKKGGGCHMVSFIKISEDELDQLFDDCF